MSAAGAVTLLHVFGPRTLNGDQPTEPNGIVLARDGRFYGTANGGGNASNGAIFRADTQGNVTTVHSFNAFATDGADPESNFTLGRDGFFYGTASDGGLPISDPGREGVVYRADTRGDVWVLHTFSFENGFSPSGRPALTQRGDGVLAAAIFGGPSNDGVTVKVDLRRATPIRSLRFTPSTVTGGQTATATLTLAAPAPVGGQVVSLFASVSPGVPASVTVPPGQTTASFTVRTDPTSVPFTATVTASIGTLGLSAPLAVVPAGLAEAPPASLIMAPAAPAALALDPAFPNPFRSQTTVRYRVPEAAEVRLTVRDVLGREVAVLTEGAVAAGEYEVPFEAAALPSGLYLVRLEAGRQVQTQRVTLLR
jgi:uncharacterized repeat protein (TIGR03803 family)